jgi:hypothetical protein
VPLVSKLRSLACRGERLAWATACPDWSIVCPSCSAECVAPDANSSEEVALGVFLKFSWFDVTYVPFVNHTRRNVASINQIAQPLRSELVNLVIKGCHAGSRSSGSFQILVRKKFQTKCFFAFLFCRIGA